MNAAATVSAPSSPAALVSGPCGVANVLRRYGWRPPHRRCVGRSPCGATAFVTLGRRRISLARSFFRRSSEEFCRRQPDRLAYVARHSRHRRKPSPASRRFAGPVRQVGQSTHPSLRRRTTRVCLRVTYALCQNTVPQNFSHQANISAFKAFTPELTAVMSVAMGNLQRGSLP